MAAAQGAYASHALRRDRFRLPPHPAARRPAHGGMRGGGAERCNARRDTSRCAAKREAHRAIAATCATHDGAGKTGKNRNPSRPTIARGAGERPTGGVEERQPHVSSSGKSPKKTTPAPAGAGEKGGSQREIRTEPGRVSDERRCTAKDFGSRRFAKRARHGGIAPRPSFRDRLFSATPLPSARSAALPERPPTPTACRRL